MIEDDTVDLKHISCTYQLDTSFNYNLNLTKIDLMNESLVNNIKDMKKNMKNKK